MIPRVLVVKILIVDDSLMDRKLLVSTLRKAGISNEILEAGDGESGFKILSENFDNICLILLDWQMPKIDGIEFMRGASKVPEAAKIPIVMVTASGSEDNRKFAKEVNPRLAGYLVKPYSPMRLMEAIKPFIK